MKKTRDGYGDALVEVGENSNVVVLSADLSPSLRIKKFHEAFPERYFEVGIAEANMAGIAAGLSFCGKIPFISTFGVFATSRCYDQLRQSIAYANANVKIGASHCGVHIGEDGATHQAIEDIALTRVLPNFTVISPCDYMETKKAVHKAVRIKGPVYIRFSRNAVPELTDFESFFEVGKANILRKGSDVTVFATGLMVSKALDAAKNTELDIEVVNIHTIKPIDIETIVNSAKKTGAVVTAEDHHVIGGLGGAVCEVLSENYPVPVKRVGVGDRFGQSGKPEQLLKEYGLTSEHIIKACHQVM